MNRKKLLKKYLFLYMMSLETLTLTGCSQLEIHTTEVQEDYLEDDNFSNEDGLTRKKSSSKKNTDKEKNNNHSFDKIKSEIESIDTDDIKKNIAKKFIHLVEFISGNETINGIYFSQLDDKAKKEVKSLVKKLDKKIEKKYPDYKDPFIEKYESLQNYIKENQLDKKWNNAKDDIIDKASETKDKVKDKTKDIIGNENYNKIKEQAEEAKDKVKDNAKKGKQKIKKWYSNFKKKYE